MNPNPSVGSPYPTVGVDQGSSEGDYGPLRRVSRKTKPEQLFRPRALLQDDFRDMMDEVVPRLLTQALDTSGSSDASLLPPARGIKREASCEPPESSDSKRPAMEGGDDMSSSPPSLPAEIPNAFLAQYEQLLVQCDTLESLAEFESLMVQCDSNQVSLETLVAAHINKRAAKELPATGSPQELQTLVDEAKSIEWHTVLSRNAVRVVLGAEADLVRRRFAHRIMGSRYVMTIKQEEDAPARVKGRWCLQGHLDPDLSKKVKAGDLQSPTLSQVGRSVLFQTIASHRWQLRLGDIKGAFLAAGELPPQYRPLYATLPQGGILECQPMLSLKWWAMFMA